MSHTDQAFLDTVARIYSAQHVSMKVAAGAWATLAHAASAESGALSGTATQAATEKGVGLLELSERLNETRSWADGAGAVARQIADQLNRAATRSARATERAEEIELEYVEMEEWRFERNTSMPDGPAIAQANQHAREEKERMFHEAQRELTSLGEEFAQVIGGNTPVAPAGGAGSGSVGGAGSGGVGGAGAGAVAMAGGVGGVGGAGVAGGALRAAGYEAPNGTLIGAGAYPYSSVLGPEHGDFAGWVLSPSTGFLVDPATGREFDAAAGRWIDPITGQPFGAVTEYATRLSGLGAGPGAIASPGGLATGGAALGAVGGVGAAGAAGAGAAGAAGLTSLAGLYGGVMPPSVGHTGPVRHQMARQAVRNLGRRAHVATRFALREHTQVGGRPFTPPPGAAGTRPGTAGRLAPRNGFPAGRSPYAPGARAVAPPLAGGGAARGGQAPAGRAAPGRAATGTPARTAVPPAAAATGKRARGGSTATRPGARAVTESARTWRVRTPDAATRHQLAARPGGATPPPAGSAGRGQGRDERERPDGRPTDLTEDPDVWSPRQNATRGVLGE